MIFNYILKIKDQLNHLVVILFSSNKRWATWTVPLVYHHEAFPCVNLHCFLIEIWAEIFCYTASPGHTASTQVTVAALSLTCFCFQPFFKANCTVWPRSEAVLLNKKLHDLTLMTPVTVFSSVSMKVTMKGKKTSRSISEPLKCKRKLDLSQLVWCSGGISPFFFNASFGQKKHRYSLLSSW